MIIPGGAEPKVLAVTYCLQNSIQGTCGKGCVCVCVRERERETDPEAKNQHACVSLGVFVSLCLYIFPITV